MVVERMVEREATSLVLGLAVAEDDDDTSVGREVRRSRHRHQGNLGKHEGAMLIFGCLFYRFCKFGIKV